MMTTEKTEESNNGLSEFNGSPDFMNPAFKAYASAQFLIFAEGHLHTKERDASIARKLIIIPYILLLISCALIGFLAFQSDSDSLIQSYAIEIAAGATIFLAFPLIFLWARKKRFITYICIILASIICAILSAVTTDVTQSFFIEAVAGLVLLLSLDFGFNYILEVFEKIRIAAEEKVDKLREDIDDAEDTLSPVYGAAIGGGTIDETIVFNLIKKNTKICQALLSDDPYQGDDLISTITKVNHLKINQPIEYKRLKAYL